MILEATIPVNIKPNDPGILTLDQYLSLRNPTNKYHPSGAYQTTLDNLNYHFLPSKDSYAQKNIIHKVSYTTYSDLVVAKSDGDSDVLGFYLYDHNTITFLGYIDNRTLYYSPDLASNRMIESITADYDKAVKVKYIDKKYESVIKKYQVKYNRSRQLGTLIRTIKIKGEYIKIYVDKKEKLIRMINADGLVIALASNEWGTTLLQVADEYRGYNIGPLLGTLYIDFFNLTSGGYTPAGKSNAIKIWNARVAEYLKNGWYSELVKSSKMTNSQVRDILKKYIGSRPIPKDSTSSPTEEYLVFAEHNTIVLYDKKFYDDMDEQYIYGHAYFQSNRDEIYLYSFDYEEKHKRLFAYLTLEYAKQENYHVNVDLSASAFVDIEEYPYIERDGEYMELSKTIVDLSALLRLESLYRRDRDRHDEIKYMLIEKAENKW